MLSLLSTINLTFIHEIIIFERDEEVFWINAHPPIEKQSNKDWNTLIDLEKCGPI